MRARVCVCVFVCNTVHYLEKLMHILHNSLHVPASQLDKALSRKYCSPDFESRNDIYVMDILEISPFLGFNSINTLHIPPLPPPNSL